MQQMSSKTAYCEEIGSPGAWTTFFRTLRCKGSSGRSGEVLGWRRVPAVITTRQKTWNVDRKYWVKGWTKLVQRLCIWAVRMCSKSCVKRNEYNCSLLWFFVVSSVLIDLPCDQHPGTWDMLSFGEWYIWMSHKFPPSKMTAPQECSCGKVAWWQKGCQVIVLAKRQLALANHVK